MTPRERGARERQRRGRYEMTNRERLSKGGSIVHKLTKYNWKSRAVRHLRSLWVVPSSDMDLFFCGRREV